MPWFKCGLIVLPANYILTLCSQIIPDQNHFRMALIGFDITSGVIASKILYDRCQQVNILGSLTTNPKATSGANKFALTTAILMFLGYIVYVLLYSFKVDSYSVTALNICLCAFATLYMWMQGVITACFVTLYFNKNITALRQCLASFSTVVIVVMAIFGTISTVLPKATNSTSFYVCTYIMSLGGYVVAALFGMFIMSYEKEYRYFAEGFDSDQLIEENECFINESISEQLQNSNFKPRTHSKYS